MSLFSTLFDMLQCKVNDEKINSISPASTFPIPSCSYFPFHLTLAHRFPFHLYVENSVNSRNILNSFILPKELLGVYIAFIDSLWIQLIQSVWDFHESPSCNITNNFSSHFLTNRFYCHPQTITPSNLSNKK